MFAIIGVVVVIGMILGGYVMEHGNLSVLFQPAEVVIIGGAAAGSFLIANPKKVIIGTVKSVAKVFTSKSRPKEFYLSILALLNELLMDARKNGLLSLEKEVLEPANSKVFANYPDVMKDHHILDFICDNFKVYISASPEFHVFENLMEIDIEALHKDDEACPKALTSVADSLPGLGIVAAVLGVVITMGKISEPPEVLGHSIGAALVGTFLGILGCYGFLAPMATHMEQINHDKGIIFHVLKTALVALSHGWHPSLVVEAARRAIPSGIRPSFSELEGAMKDAKK